MFKVITPIFVLVSLALSLPVFAKTDCPEHFLSGKEPVLVVPLYRNQQLCYSGFATAYNYATRTPFYSAEHLTKARISAAKKMEREDNFHEETALTPQEGRATLTDYRGSGFDKGHIAPNADMMDKQSQFDSFSLVNIVPQVPEQNQGIWAAIESSTRYLALKDGDLYVVSGPLYGASHQKIKGRIAVPDALFKAIYNPKSNEAAVYFSANRADANYQIISVKSLIDASGIDPFPTLNAEIKNKVGYLPAPKLRNKGTNIHSQSNHNTSFEPKKIRQLLRHILQ